MMDSAFMVVIEAGVGNSIQDAGRFGYRPMGVPVSGCLDPLFARCANALLGNRSEAASIEIRSAGLTLEVKGARVRVAIAGNVIASVSRPGEAPIALLPWRSFLLFPHDILSITEISTGVAYLAVAGGILSPLELQSRSTYTRAKIGGIDGEPLRVGHQLRCEAFLGRYRSEFYAPAWVEDQRAPIRVMAGPQYDHFTHEAQLQFVNARYQVSAERDRMGVRLAGSPLEHRTKEAADIVSDGVLPGAIQVPGNGLPIVLLADCQTVGGYPKIANVISTDLRRFAQMETGQSLLFNWVSLQEANLARQVLETQWRWWHYAMVHSPTPVEFPVDYRVGAAVVDDDSLIQQGCSA